MYSFDPSAKGNSRTVEIYPKSKTCLPTVVLTLQFNHVRYVDLSTLIREMCEALVLYCLDVLLVRLIYNSSEAKASRVIIYKFPVKLPFPIHSGLQRASKSRHVHSNGVLYGRHSIICACVNAYSLYTVLSLMTTASDCNCNEKFRGEVDLNQERERTRQRKREDVEKR